MFGTKQTKRQRLQHIVEELSYHPDGLTQIELAMRLGVPSSTIARDLPLLEDRGIYLQEYAGRISLAQDMYSSRATRSSDQ
jgi:DeoR/GlpR family transcriptional regulator of sugar metabolism